jgi:signal transduction histidine kinase
MLVAIGAGVAISATVGSLSLLAGGTITSDAVPKVWRTWWLGDACGALVVVPLAIAWWHAPPLAWWRGRALEASLVLTAVAGSSAIALGSSRPLSYLVFPALIWAALRFGQWGATTAVAVTTGFVMWNSSHYEGPFAFHSNAHTVLSTQLFIAITALTTLSLAAVVSERQVLSTRLRASRARLVDAGDAERRRIEHNLHDGAQQRLTAIIVRLGLASDRAREAPAEAPAAFEDAEIELTRALDELRELARGIHPTILTELGLARAVASIAARSTVPVEVLRVSSARLEPRAEATAYYVIAEAVTNAQKHARATRIRVSASLGGRVLRVEVSDDGAGGAQETPGSGLEGLRDRVEALGGTFEVRSDYQGTRIRAALPAALVAA